MRTIRNASFLCQSNAKVAAPRHSGLRWASSSSIDPSPIEPFDLPRLVIDLDAADNPYVRQLQDEPAPESRPKLQRPPLPLRVFQPKPKHGALLDRSTATPPDLLQYALLGNGSSGDPRNVFIRSLFKAQHLSLRDTYEHNMKHLTLSLASESEKSLQRVGFDHEYQRRLLWAMLSYSDYSQLCRLLTSLSSTKEGCLFLLDKGRSLEIAIERMRNRRREPSTLSISVLLNNIIKSIKSHGLTPGKRLSGLALLYASRTGTLTAVRNHLQYHMQTPGAFDSTTFTASLYSLAKVYAKNLPLSPSLGWSDFQTRRKELLRLVTGWNSENGTVAGITRELSFASMITPGTNFFSRYIIVLGEMGLSNAIWFEWQALDKAVPPGELLFNAQSFAIALILAKDPDRALKVLESVPNTVTPTESDPLGIENAKTEGLSPRAQFRIKPYKEITIDSIPRRLEDLILDHYAFHRLKASPELQIRLRDKLQGLNHKLQTSPNDAIRTLEDLLVVQFPQYIPDKSLLLKWRPVQNQREGEEANGLVVMPLVGNIPVYQKPDGTRIQVDRH